VFFGEADSDFYTANPVFWVKIGVFVLIGLASLPPTIRFLQWNNRMKQDPARLPGEAEKSRVMAWLKAELALFALMPVLAAAMARGVGL
jgi:putative membrane protein